LVNSKLKKKIWVTREWEDQAEGAILSARCPRKKKRRPESDAKRNVSNLLNSTLYREEKTGGSTSKNRKEEEEAWR
jgi:hypothetical protein